MTDSSSLTISINVDSVKDAVGEILRRGILVVVTVDGADRLQKRIIIMNITIANGSLSLGLSPK